MGLLTRVATLTFEYVILARLSYPNKAFVKNMIKSAIPELVILTLLFALAGCEEFKAAKPPEKNIVYIRPGLPLAAKPEFVDDIPAIRLPNVEGLGGLETPEPVENADTSVQPHRSVGRMNVFRTGSSGHCTATLIENTRIIATAAHCLYNSVDGWIEDIEFDLRSGGVDPQQYGWRCAALNRRWVDSEPDDTDITLDQVAVDIAFVLLDGPTTSPLSISNAKSAEVTISGYPAKHNSGRIMVTGTAPATEISDGILRTFIDHGEGASGSAYVNGNSVLGVLSGGNGAGLHVAAPVNAFSKELLNFVSDDCPADKGIAADQLALLAPTITPNLWDLFLNSDQTIQRVKFAPNPKQPQSTPVLRVNFSNDPLNCTAICEGGNFNFCQVFAPDGARIAQLAEFEDLVKERNGGSIAVSEMHTIFQIEEVEDTCERGPLRLSGGQVSNTGPDRCTINASTRISSLPVNVDISIPASLRADIKSLSSVGITVEFASESEAMSVRLSDEYLNDKWGGSIQLLSTNANGIFASTAKSCISIVR